MLVLDRIHDGHLRHLIGKHIPEAERDKVLKSLNAGPHARPQVVAELEKHRGGVGPALAAEWRHRGAGAVHAFTMPLFEGATAPEVLVEATGQLKRPMQEGLTHELSPPDLMDVGNHVLRVGLRPGAILEAVVDVVKLQTYQKGTRFENEQKTTREVLLRVHLAHPMRLTEAYGGHEYASLAMIGLMKTVFGHTKTKDSRPFEVLQFQDHHVRMCAHRLGLKQCRADVVKDPRGLAGRIVFEGPEDVDGELLPIDIESDEFAVLLVSAQNDERLFLYEYTHPDGWTEKGRVAFDVRSESSPGILFLQKTSMTVKKWILLDLVKG